MQSKPDIPRIQRRQTALLRVLDQLCQTHHITYFLAYGSLLGAVRHQGPIPWDDDLDILVPRADWLRLQPLCQEHLADLCMVQTPWTDPAYRKPYVPFKLRDRFSSFVEEDAKYWQGNYIDIFPLDLLKPEQLRSWDAVKKRASRLSSLYLSKNRKDLSLSPLRRNLRYLLQCVAGLVHPRHLLRWTDAKVRMFQGLPATGLPDAFNVSAALSLNKGGGADGCRSRNDRSRSIPCGSGFPTQNCAVRGFRATGTQPARCVTAPLVRGLLEDPTRKPATHPLPNL